MVEIGRMIVRMFNGDLKAWIEFAILAAFMIALWKLVSWYINR